MALQQQTIGQYIFGLKYRIKCTEKMSVLGSEIDNWQDNSNFQDAISILFHICP